jgi:hypothetical protein
MRAFSALTFGLIVMMGPLPIRVQAEDNPPQVETHDGKINQVIVPGKEQPEPETRQGNSINLDYDHQAQNSQEIVHAE